MIFWVILVVNITPVKLWLTCTSGHREMFSSWTLLSTSLSQLANTPRGWRSKRKVLAKKKKKPRNEIYMFFWEKYPVFPVRKWRCWKPAGKSDLPWDCHLYWVFSRTPQPSQNGRLLWVFDWGICGGANPGQGNDWSLPWIQQWERKVCGMQNYPQLVPKEVGSTVINEFQEAWGFSLAEGKAAGVHPNTAKLIFHLHTRPQISSKCTSADMPSFPLDVIPQAHAPWTAGDWVWWRNLQERSFGGYQWEICWIRHPKWMPAETPTQPVGILCLQSSLSLEKPRWKSLKRFLINANWFFFAAAE